MKKPRWTLYSLIKDWQKLYSTMSEPSSDNRDFSPQAINLEAFFDTQSYSFAGVFCPSFVNAELDQLKELFEEALGNIHYWLCHNRSIRCIIPLDAKNIAHPKTLNLICHQIQESDLPVGLITLAIHGLHYYPNLKPQLDQLKRIGLEIDFFEFSGFQTEFNWLKEFQFSGVHLPLQFVRSVHQCKEQRDLLDKVMAYQEVYKFHIYFRGISLVHDLVFARKNGIHFSYGPLMMPAVSKHQILKIKESQFINMPTLSTPSLQTQDGQT